MIINGIPQNEIVVINQYEFMEYILNYILSDEYQKRLSCDEHGNDPIYKAGFMAGLNWAALLSGQCKKYLHYIPEEEDK